MRIAAAGWLLLCPLALAAAGCSKPTGPPLVSVGGTVTLDSKPLSGAQVAFVPTGSTPGQDARGYTDKEGRYKVISRHGTGAPVGQYRVAISKLVMPDGSDFPLDSDVGPADSPARETLPPRYQDLQQTVLTATVPEGGTDKLDFALKTGR